jgi:hypothetical protein
MNSLLSDTNLFLHLLFKKVKNLQFCEIYGYKKGTLYFLSFLLLLDPESGMKKSGSRIWINIPDS